MSTSATATSFATALKDLGIAIENEALFISELDAAKDKDVKLESLSLKGHLKNISFTVDKNTDAEAFTKGLTKAFLDHGFDGYTYRTFFSKLKA